MSPHYSCTDSYEHSSGCWELNLGLLLAPSQLHSLSLCLLQPKDLFIIINKYTVAVFRRCQILLHVVVSHHVVAGI